VFADVCDCVSLWMTTTCPHPLSPWPNAPGPRPAPDVRPQDLRLQTRQRHQARPNRPSRSMSPSSPPDALSAHHVNRQAPSGSPSRRKRQIACPRSGRDRHPDRGSVFQARWMQTLKLGHSCCAGAACACARVRQPRPDVAYARLQERRGQGSWHVRSPFAQTCDACAWLCRNRAQSAPRDRPLPKPRSHTAFRRARGLSLILPPRRAKPYRSLKTLFRFSLTNCTSAPAFRQQLFPTPYRPHLPTAHPPTC
jgi:hypothetical protein